MLQESWLIFCGGSGFHCSQSFGSLVKTQKSERQKPTVNISLHTGKVMLSQAKNTDLKQLLPPQKGEKGPNGIGQ